METADEKNRSLVDKLGDELDRMMDDLFGEEEQEFVRAAVTAGTPVEF